MTRVAAAVVCCFLATACTKKADAPPPTQTAAARNLLLITIDTLRADRVGAYGYKNARTPAMDGLAARGARFENAFSSAPITLTSHATIMTGRYPPGHGARHNGMRVDGSVPTIADTLARQGFATGAFVAAFPLDHRFGLNKGFQTYSDRMPRGALGRLANERAGRVVVDEASAWLNDHRAGRFFLWVHLFEPHAPYGDPSDRRPVAQRYDDEIAEADRQVGRLLQALGDASSTLVVVAADHGEAFGEHGEFSHSLFVYDTTLRVPLIVAGPGVATSVVRSVAGLVDLAPTMLLQLGIAGFDSDGMSLAEALRGRELPPREQLYAETFAPLLDFGWSPLRSLRTPELKFIAAPKPELFDLRSDPSESRNIVASDAPRAAALNDRVDRISPATLTTKASTDPEAAARLQSLGYVGGGAAGANVARPDPKDKRDLAARLAQVTSGELEGSELRQALENILKEDPSNPQAHVRLGYVLLDAKQCADAERHFRAAIAGHLPGADALLGLASCQASARRFADAGRTLTIAEAAEPDNPVIIANRGILLSDSGHPVDAVPLLERALTIDPDFHEARFNLALAYLRAGQKPAASAAATELLKRLPPDAPQRPEVERLRDAAK